MDLPYLSHLYPFYIPFISTYFLKNLQGDQENKPTFSYELGLGQDSAILLFTAFFCKLEVVYGGAPQL